MKRNFNQILKSILMMVVFFTRIPVKYEYEFDETDYDIGIMFLPVVGAIIGIGLFLIKIIASYANTYVSSLILLIYYVWITGGLHIDGLADTFDGIFSGRDKNRIFEIMKDSRVGSFGAIAISLLMIGYIILFSDNTAGTILMMAIVGKSSILASASISQYAKEEKGLGTRFIEQCNERERYMGFGFTALFALVVNYKLIIPAAGTFIIAGMLTQHIKKILGGMTGDTLGYIGEISQIIFLLIASLVL